MTTARFTDVVAAAGRPQVHSLWVALAKDSALKRAVRECRVMTIHQMLRGTKKDYGTVGLQADQSSQVLVFPKSLKKFSEARIVGIDYKLIIQPDPKDPVKLAPAKPKPRANKVEPALRTGSARAERTLHPPKPAAQKRVAKPERLTREELVAEIRRAVRELKAGKAVAAAERLGGLIENE